MSDEKNVEVVKIVDEKNVKTVTGDEQSLAEKILNARKNVPIEKKNLVGFGVIYIHGLTCLEKAEYLEDCVNSNDGKGTPKTTEVKLIQLCVRDEEGKRLFKSTDIGKLQQLPAVIVTAISDVCARLSGIGAASREAILENFDRVATDVS